MGKALLIGAPLGALKGTTKDLELMTEVLEARAFECQVLTGSDATREGIMNALDSFFHHLIPDEACVFYYTGHGTLLPHPLRGPLFPSLVPMDFEASGPGDFRGILDIEMSSFFVELGQKTADITGIWDTCHAAGMTRRDHFQTKYYASEAGDYGLREHFASLKPLNTQVLQGRAITGVRIFATTEDSQATEYRSSRHGHTSLFTEKLCMQLSHAGNANLSWRQLMTGLSSQVHRLLPGQHPCAFGNLSRRPFENADAEKARTFSCYLKAPLFERPIIQASGLQGIAKGDRFLLHDSYKETVLGEVEVTDVRGNEAQTAVIQQFKPLRMGMTARLREQPSKRLQVMVKDLDPQAFKVIHESPLLDDDLSDPSLAEVIVEKQGAVYKVTDSEGLLLAPTTQNAPEAKHHLEVLARHRNLVLMENLPQQSEIPCELVWGQMVHGTKRALPMHGASLCVGDFIYLDLYNTETMTYFHLFAVNMDRQIASLIPSYPMGLPLRVGERRTLGLHPRTQQPGWELTWTPAGHLDPHQGHGESLFAIFINQPHDLSHLSGPGFSEFRAGHAPVVNRGQETGFQYEVRTIHYELCPVEVMV